MFHITSEMQYVKFQTGSGKKEKTALTYCKKNPQSSYSVMKDDQNDYLKNLIFRANEDIAVIENLYKTGPEIYPSSICFHAQQAVEKFLKVFLVFHNVDFPKTHDLELLLFECQKIDKSGFDFNFGSLTDFGVSIRYPDDFFMPDKEDRFLCRNIALEVKKVVEKKIIR
ncbi:MAG: HEPN domain-containing protein [Bacteroidales bacterium]|nr:HEPN domain-containing protein [Bacteroidales bacterium]